MTLEYSPRGNSGSMNATIVECPFCGADLRERSTSVHLEKCDEFFEAWGPEGSPA